MNKELLKNISRKQKIEFLQKLQSGKYDLVKPGNVGIEIQIISRKEQACNGDQPAKEPPTSVVWVSLENMPLNLDAFLREKDSVSDNQLDEKISEIQTSNDQDS